MTNLNDKILGLVLGIFLSAFICAMLIFYNDNASWFELVKSLSTLLVAGAFIIATLTYIRQGKWRKSEDSLEDSKLFCEAAVEGLEKSAEKIQSGFKGADWHIATILLEESSIVARNITNQSVRDIYNLKKSMIFNEVLAHIYKAKESDFSGIAEVQYGNIKSKVMGLASKNISTLTEAERKKVCEELVGYADELKLSGAIDISSIVEVCIYCSLIEHDDVFESNMINRSHNEISPDYLDNEVLKKAIYFIENNFESSSLSFYVLFLKVLSEFLLKCSADRREQLIGN